MQPVAPDGFRGVFRTDDDARAVYSEAAGIGRALPRAIAVPVDAEDVGTLIRWAHTNQQPVIPRGSGSSMAGGAIGDGVVVDLGRLRVLGDPDAERLCIRAGSGVLRGELSRRAASAGLRFPVDPSSGEFCTIGGMASTNAAGPHSLLHGSVRPWVLALDCVFDDGSVAQVRRGAPPPLNVPAVERFMREVHPRLVGADVRDSQWDVLKNSSGYAIHAYSRTRELVDLLVGSEGTLALFTAVEVALIPFAGARASLLAAFRDLGRAADAAVAARASGAAACELLDRTFLTIAAKAGSPLPIGADTEAALLVEVESEASAGAAAGIDRLRALFRSMGAAESIVAHDAGHEAELWSLRHAASPAIARMDASLRSMQFIEDAAVPPSQLRSYVVGVRSVLEKHRTAGVIFGHAGDAHVHVNPLLDVSRGDWRSRVEGILLDVTDLVARLRGTLTGEHGDGRLRTPLLDRVWGKPSLDLFSAIKDAFDPTGFLNPGVKVPLPRQRALDVVKYDPAAAELPTGARHALDVVDRERGYSRFRLELL